jgi:hypothetical protein
MYPYCVIADVELLTLQGQSGGAYSTTTRPTAVQVNEFIDRIAASLRGLLRDAGYDTDNLYEKKDSVALAITSGASKKVVVVDADNFAVSNLVKLEGAVSTARKWEFCSVTAINSTTNEVTLDLVANGYDAGASITVIYDALLILRDLNSIGSAAKSDMASFMSISPSQSERAKEFWKLYWGSEQTRDGIWAIKNVPGFLGGATQTTLAAVTPVISSYGSEHPSTSDDENVVEWIGIESEF